jgi:hypothetical protein
MDFSDWNAEDKFERWMTRVYILFFSAVGPGLIILLLYLLRHY